MTIRTIVETVKARSQDDKYRDPKNLIVPVAIGLGVLSAGLVIAKKRRKG